MKKTYTSTLINLKLIIYYSKQYQIYLEYQDLTLLSIGKLYNNVSFAVVDKYIIHKDKLVINV